MSLKRIIIYTLLGSYCFLSFILSLNPYNRNAWLIENLILWSFLFTCVYLYYKGIRLSLISSIIIWIAMCWHSIGAFYSFPKVPIGFWVMNLFKLSRNPYDRMGHYIFGLLAYPLNDALKYETTILNLLLIILSILGISALYEIFEWMIISYTEYSTGFTFIASQGDIWDAQKDMLCVLLGAISSSIVSFFLKKKTKILIIK